jgi:hypothetical protein
MQSRNHCELRKLGVMIDSRIMPPPFFNEPRPFSILNFH